MINYELIEHTADIGLRVWGQDTKEIYVNAALALMDISAQKKDPLKTMATRVLTIKAEAENEKDLLVHWLSEIISLGDCEGVVFIDFYIHELTDHKLVAEGFGASDHEFIGKTEVKAATYHNLKLEKQGQRYMAEIIFDV